ncbi:MAG: hypothetical protein NZ739_11205 [Verrucomicrobiae bacterium]|nr:hypothetical protein [Verrucomicrobiae bacterium]
MAEYYKIFGSRLPQPLERELTELGVRMPCAALQDAAGKGKKALIGASIHRAPRGYKHG